MEVLLALLAAVLTLLIFLINHQMKYWQRRGIPHLAPTFLAGNLTTARHFSEVLSEVYNKFKGTGPFAGFYLSVQKSIIVLDLALVRNICAQDFRNFHERGSYHNVRDDPLSGNLVFMDGEMWRRLRTKVTPAFTSSKIKYMFGTVVTVGKELQQVVTEMTTPEAGSDSGSESKGQVLELTDLMARYTADVIGSTAFGLECNSLRDPQADFVVMGKRFFTHPRHSRVVESLMHTFPNVARMLRLRLVNKSVHNFYMRIVRETVAQREAHAIKRRDFMDLLIALKSKEKPASPDACPQESAGLTLDEIAAQAFVFLVAGFESSSTTMSYALYELARHPAVQSKLRREINNVAEQHKNEMSYECMKDMKYLDHVVDETLRMHPPLPFILRKAHERYETSDPAYFIDKGTYCLISSLAIHMDPDIYPEPELFQPERFAPQEVLKRPDYAWLPFGAGPRNCIGARFAKMQICVGLIYLLRTFEFSLAPETQVPCVLNNESFLLNPKDGIRLRVARI